LRSLSSSGRALKEERVLEALIVVSLFAALLVAGGRPREEPAGDTATIDLGGDLPCPWCLGPTREDDRFCPNCGQRFG
jgi:hypothetical protein